MEQKRNKKNLAGKIRLARLAQELSQTEVAKLLECTQASVSRIESGDFLAVSEKTLHRLCSLLGIAGESRVEGETAAKTFICPTAGCLQNAPYLVKDAIHFRPRPVKKPRPTARFCGYCGEELIAQCPHCQCDLQPEGAFCRDCGKPLVNTPPEIAAHQNPHAYAEAFSRRLSALTQHLSFDQVDGENRSA